MKLTSISRPLCEDCAHFLKEERGYKCLAFKDGIPDDILFGFHDHHEPHPDDNGIQFKKKPKEKLYVKD